MSIRDQILALEAAGKLAPYRPPEPRPARRRLYLAEDVVRSLNASDSPVNLLHLGGFIRSALTLWTVGGLVYSSASGRAGFLKRLERPPSEIWEMRVTEPDVQVRLFGRFAEPDTLVVTHIHTRNKLGRKKKNKSRAWQDAMNECKAKWDELFPDHEPFSSNTVHDYVSENCDDFKI